MKPSDKFKKIIALARLCAKICGADVADPNYEINFVTYLVFASLVIYFVFSIYTVNLQIHEGWGVLLQSFCMVGSVLQGITKLVTGIVHKKGIYSQTVFLTSVYLKYELKGKDYIASLRKCISRIETVVKVVAMINIVMVLIMLSVPLVMWFVTGHRYFPMQFYVPFIDPDTGVGYFLTIGAQTYCLFFGAFGNFAGDIFMLVFFAHSTLMLDVMRLKIKELNKLSEDFGSPMVSDMLQDVLNWHQTYSNSIALSDKIYFSINTVQIAMCGLSIVLTLFIIFTSDWPGSYGYLCMLFAIMYLYCGMGTLTEVANDNMTEEIYGICWYNMTITQRKIVSFMLMKSQSPKKITVGGIIPLSVSTGLQVTKTVYSVFMMLVNS